VTTSTSKSINMEQLSRVLDESTRAIYNQFVSLLNKMGRGETLSPSEHRLFGELKSKLEEIVELETAAVDEGDVVMTTRGIGSFFDVTDRQIRNWKKAGCLPLGRNKWSLKQVLAWWHENVYGGRGNETPEVQKGREEYWVYKGKNERVNYEKTMGALIPEDDIHDDWASVVMEFNAALDHLSTRLPSVLVAKTSEHDIRCVIEGEVESIKSILRETGEFRPPVGDGD